MKKESSAFKVSSDTVLIRNEEVLEESLHVKEQLSLAWHFEMPQ